jgi:ABC-type protease/lipase transport system fused ATPase/permease subunit
MFGLFFRMILPPWSGRLGPCQATSDLDSATEALVQEALQRAAKGVTSVTVAHRLSTIRGADQIFVLLDGQVADGGWNMGLSENVVYPKKPNGFADHYPYFLWL